METEGRTRAKSPVIRATEEGSLPFERRHTERRATHRPDRLIRFQTDLAVYSELLLDEGRSIEIIDQEALQLVEVFKIVTPARQQALVDSLRKSINRRLRGRLSSSLDLSHNLQTEDERDSNAIGKDDRTWRDLFDHSPSSDRIAIVRSLEKTAEEMLIANFGKYLETWKQILSGDPTMSHEEVKQRIIKQRQKFEHASRRGKVGLSKHLRETIDASSTAKFSAFLELYEVLLRENVNGKTGLPTPEAWIEEYGNASYARRAGIINRLHSNIAVLMTPPHPIVPMEPK